MSVPFNASMMTQRLLLTEFNLVPWANLIQYSILEAYDMQHMLYIETPLIKLL